MKILITGANGQLGRELVRQYKEKDVEIIRTGSKDLDITEQDHVYRFIQDVKPNVIVNCAAHTAVDKCETDIDNAYKINAIGAKNLAQAAYQIGAEIVHISTDYVFDGEGSHELTEFDATNPQSVYGQSKLQGENLVKEFNPRHYIVRTAWLYGEGNKFVRTMLNLSKENSVLKVVNDQHGTPTSTVDAARVIIKLVEEKNYGLFHCTCKGQSTRYEFAKEIFRLCNIDIDVIPITSEEYPRPAMVPKYAVLRNYMLELTTGDITRDWKEALERYIQQLHL